MIDRFHGKYRFLSNFYPGDESSLEHKYQAEKTEIPELKLFITSSPTPAIAKKRGKLVEIREDWDEIKDDVMLRLLREKFDDWELFHKLLSTGDEELIEGNNWHDEYWGVCNGFCHKGPHPANGQNKLGKLLMQVRNELRKNEEEKK